MPNALNSGQIRVAGTGAFWKAPLGTVIPTDSTTAWNAAFVNLGFATDGFEMSQDKKTQGITGWQSLEELRLIVQSLVRKFKFELLQSNGATLSLAWGGATITTNSTPVGGAITIATGGVLTSATAHGLVVGNAVNLATVVTSTGITALTTYYIISVPTTTTLTLSATPGGVALTTTVGSGTGLSLVGPYKLTIPDSSTVTDYILGIDWSDGTVNQRIIIQRASQPSLPTIKSVRTDGTRYELEVQALKPADGTDSVLVYGVDAAVAGA